MNIKKIFVDFVLNLFSSFLPLFALQFLIQPYVARAIGADRYGSLLLVLGILNIGVGVFGSTLNNARLIDNQLYEKDKGDYPLLLVIFCLCSSMFTFFALRLYQIPLDWFAYGVLISTSILAVSNSYLVSEYRIRLNYKNILLSKLFLTIGYGCGLLFFYHTKRWELIFFTGYCLEFIYVMSSTQISREPYIITLNIKGTLRRLLFLILSAALGSVLTYLDRLIIFPVFGGNELSIYYAASLVGKTLSLATGPMSGVLLSYIVKINSVTKKQYALYCFILLMITSLGFLICLIISKPLIGLLYPDLLSASLLYIPYTVGASMFTVFYSFVWPFVLRFGKNPYPLIITVLKTVVYLSLSLMLIKAYGILGIAIASLFASATQALVVFLLGLRLTIITDKNKTTLGSKLRN